MESKENFKSKFIKILVPFVIILGVIYLVKYGYYFGQWIHKIFN